MQEKVAQVWNSQDKVQLCPNGMGLAARVFSVVLGLQFFQAVKKHFGVKFKGCSKQ